MAPIPDPLSKNRMNRSLAELAADPPPQVRLPRPPDLIGRAHEHAGYAGGKAAALGLGIGAAASLAGPRLVRGVGNLMHGYAWDGGARGERLAKLDEDARRNVENGAPGLAAGGIAASISPGHEEQRSAGPQPDGGYLLTAEEVADIGGGDRAAGLAVLRDASERSRGRR